ncbi:hypothetical protein MFLAVUS_007764 [Mucor flavus]|uniref:Uncharacterized protein n=1 Tax=Mucor flavus TaxID=439312 RepID=A0ABP9Z582_9FUNG
MSEKNHFLNAPCNERDSNFGVNPQWIVEDMNIMDIFRTFRQRSIEGAQMRRHLSNSRTLSLSYMFLLSATDNCTISKILPNKQKSIMTNALKKNQLLPIDIDVRVLIRIILDLLTGFFLHNNKSNNRQQEEEASLIIDTMKPYIIHCLVSQIDNVEYGW